MGFSNPTTVVQVAGGYLENVTVNVPLLSRDTLYWPCLSGEPYPPTFASSGNYGNVAGKACVTSTYNQGNPYAIWPKASRIGYDTTKTTLRAEAKLYQTAIPSGTGGNLLVGYPPAGGRNVLNYPLFSLGAVSSLNAPANAGCGLYADTTGALWLYVSDGTNTSFTAAGPLTLNSWLPVAFVVATTGVQLELGGVVAATSPVTFTTSAQPNAGTGGGASSLAELQITYLEPVA